MSKKIFYTLFITSFLCQLSCKTIVSKDFDGYSTRFVSDFRELFPDEGPLSIDNVFLEKLAIPTPTYLDSVRQFHQNYTSELKQFDRSILSATNAKGAQKVDNILKSVGNFLTDYSHNPQRFNVLNGFKRILNADYASDDYRTKTLLSKLEQVPIYYETAKQCLNNVNRQSADAAVEQHLATFLFFENELPVFLEKNGQAGPPQYKAQIEASKLAIKDYVAFVESFRLN
jgi:hypothetical protein